MKKENDDYGFRFNEEQRMVYKPFKIQEEVIDNNLFGVVEKAVGDILKQTDEIALERIKAMKGDDYAISDLIKAVESGSIEAYLNPNEFSVKYRGIECPPKSKTFVLDGVRVVTFLDLKMPNVSDIISDGFSAKISIDQKYY